MNPLILVIDGNAANAADITDALPRAVIISLFTWRRANPDDDLPGLNRFGWWGDTYPETTNDRIGSRLWLLSRAKLTLETIAKAKEYAEEALKWLVDDGVAAGYVVEVERVSLSQLSLGITITRGDASKLNIRFTNAWDYINAL